MAETTPEETTPRTAAKKATKKAPAKKATAKKASAKKASTPKAAPRKAPAKKADGQAPASSPDRDSGSPPEQPSSRAPGDDSGDDGGNGRSNGGSNGGGRRASNGGRAALLAAQQLVDLTGREFEGIVGISRTEEGWTAQVEVLEMRRIPETTDVLAVYEVAVDQDGDLLGYRRTDRYTRGSSGEDHR